MTSKEWQDIENLLQLGQINHTEIPKLLYKCLLDRKAWETRTLLIIRRINQLQIEIIEELEPCK